MRINGWGAGGVLVGVLFGSALPGRGDGPATAPERTITATATATAYVEPDGARLTFQVASTEPADKSAREANERQVKRVRDALAADLPGKVNVQVHVSAPAASATVAGADTGEGSRHLVSKRARTFVEVVVQEKDLAKLRTAVGRLAEIVTENGGTAMDGDTAGTRVFRAARVAGRGEEVEAAPGPRIDWLCSAAGVARRDAIRRATREAVADAEAAAGAGLGDGKFRVTEIYVATPDDSAAPSVRPLREFEAKASVQIPVRVTVQVTGKY